MVEPGFYAWWVRNSDEIFSQRKTDDTADYENFKQCWEDAREQLLADILNEWTVKDLIRIIGRPD